MRPATENHFRETETLIRSVSIEDITNWLLNAGYYPEENVLPPCFRVKGFELKSEPYNKDFTDLARRKLVTVSYPKGLLTLRNYGIQHPWNYHDIVYYLSKQWTKIIDHIFHQDQKVFSYSFPIPVSKKESEDLSPLRTGRMIYEWIEMAEKDLIIDARKFKILTRTDISNFYPSIYTHSIAWAIHDRDKALADKEYKLLGNKIDRLFQYSNDGRTNGIPVGSALRKIISSIALIH